MTDTPPVIEAMARRMAIADGLDPDAHMKGNDSTFKMRASEFTGYAVTRGGPVWKSYRRRANLTLAGLHALQDYVAEMSTPLSELSKEHA